MLLGRKEQRVVRYILIPAVLLLIGTGIYYFAGSQITDMLVADIQYALVQSNTSSGQADSSIKLPDMTDGTVVYGDWTVPKVGEQYGEISCEDVAMSVPLYYGDSDEILEKGAGQSLLSSFPGQGGTTLVGGHDTTFFAPLEQVEQGMDIVVDTGYGRFTYTVEDISIIEGSDYDMPSDGQKLVLYTCYPYGKVNENRSKKILYVCSLIEGPVIGGGSVE